MSKNNASTVRESMAFFELTEAEMRAMLMRLLSHGADYADIFCEHTTTESVYLQNHIVSGACRNIDFGVGLRAVGGDRTGYAYCEKIDHKLLLQAADTAARIAAGKVCCGVAPFAAINVPNRYPVVLPLDEIRMQTCKHLLEYADRYAAALDKRIVRLRVNLVCKTTRVLFVNNLGQAYTDLRPLFNFAVTCSMEHGGQSAVASASRSFRSDAAGITEALAEVVVREAVEHTARQFGAGQPRGGEMSVVMASGSSGIFLHESIGHAFEADFNRRGMSVFSGRMGQRICSDAISVIDDGTLLGNRGAVNIDDEGVPGQCTTLVERGVLRSYLHDRISARHYGVSPTGNGRRESFRYPPLPRMRATYMHSGTHKPNELIEAVKHGIYVDTFTNGQVKIGIGDFTFYAKTGYMIENGRLTRPVKDINIIGNGPQALADISMVADNYIMDNSGWMCGKDGQSCPVACGMPGILISKIIVG